MVAHLALAALVISLAAQLPPTGRQQTRLSTFVSDGEQRYLEITDAGSTHKVYTQERSGARLVFILDANNVPDVMAFVNPLKKRAIVVEYRQKQTVRPTALRLLDAAHMSRVTGNATFRKWKSDFAVFRVGTTGNNRTFKSTKNLERVTKPRLAHA
jgi:hypothetical protein